MASDTTKASAREHGLSLGADARARPSRSAPEPRYRPVPSSRDPRDPPFRLAAEAVGGLVANIMSDRPLRWLIPPLALVPYAVLEWLRFGLGLDAFPKTATVLALAGIATTAVMLRRHLAETADGPDDETAGGRVEDALEHLATRGYHVFHDVPCSDFEIRHVAVGPTGIYTIETAGFEKPSGRRARVVVDRNGLAVAGRAPAHDLLARASAQASSLAAVLKAASSKNLRVRPVLLFPGWTVEQKCPRMTSDPWVLDTKAFLKMIERAQPLLSDEHVGLASYQVWRVCEGRTGP
jgi:hypothetical protein